MDNFEAGDMLAEYISDAFNVDDPRLRIRYDHYGQYCTMSFYFEKKLEKKFNHEMIHAELNINFKTRSTDKYFVVDYSFKTID